MTQTIHKPSGRNAVEVYADYGMGKTRLSYTVEWRKLTAEDRMWDDEEEPTIPAEARWMVSTADNVYYFRTAKECRDFAYRQFC